MNILKIIILAFIVIIACLVAVYAYYGGFSKVIISTKEQGGEILVYKEVVGDYSQTGKITDEVYYSLLNDFGIETYKGCGIFYNNPKEVEKSKLQSDVGCILEIKDSAKIDLISTKYKIKYLPKGKYAVGEFPMKGAISIIVGITKVYPALNKYTGGNIAKPITEIYDVPNKKTIYRIEL